MKYLKRFNEQEISIEDWCMKLHLYGYTINEDNTVDIGTVDISSKDLDEIPIRFGIVDESFECHDNNLTTMKNCPIKVGWHFNCEHNKLISLQGVPKEIVGWFSCTSNNLTSLKGGPSKVEGDFSCNGNFLTSLKDSPKEIDEDFICSINQLTSLIDGPETVGGNYNCYKNKLLSLDGLPFNFDMDLLYFRENPIWHLCKLFGSYKKYKYSLGYEYLDDANIVKFKFKEACEEVGVIMPDSIPGYTYI
jgi:hypothetical protein